MGNVRTLIASALVSGIAYLVMGSAKGWLLAGICFAVVSFAVYAGSVVANSLRQRLSPRDLMGRIGAAWRGVVWGAFPIGSLIGGGLAVLGGLRLPLYIAGAAQCVVALVIARPLTRSLAASERAAQPADQAVVGAGTAPTAFGTETSSNGGKPLTTTSDGDRPTTAGLADEAVQAPAKRRLHSRTGHGPLYWGRSSRNWRR